MIYLVGVGAAIALTTLGLFWGMKRDRSVEPVSEKGDVPTETDNTADREEFSDRFPANSLPRLELESILGGIDWAVNDLALDPQGNRLIATDYSSLQMWKIDRQCQTEKPCLPEKQIDVPALWVYSVAIDPKREILATGTWKTIELWNLNSGEKLGILRGHLNAVTSLAIAPNGKLLISGSNDETLDIWALNSPEENKSEFFRKNNSPIATLTGHTGEITDLAISADGQILASASSDRTIKIWDLGQNVGNEIPKNLLTLVGHDNTVRSVAIAPDGERLASGSLDQTIKIWNLKTGQLLHSLNAHQGTVLSVAISPDGELLASGSADRTIKLWQMETGALLNRIEAHSDAVRIVTFSADGGILVSGSGDKTIKIWRVQR